MLLFKRYFSSILKVVEKNSGKPKENEDDTDYGIQYFNKFQSVGYRLNHLIYYIKENEIKNTLCKPTEKKELSEKSGKLVRVSVFEELL